MAVQARRVPRKLVRAVSLILLVVFILSKLSCQPSHLLNPLRLLSSQGPSEDTKNNLSLNEKQCRATFPGLMQEIDQSVARGPFDLKKLPDNYQGIVEGRIKDGKVCVYWMECNCTGRVG